MAPHKQKTCVNDVLSLDIRQFHSGRAKRERLLSSGSTVTWFGLRYSNPQATIHVEITEDVATLKCSQFRKHPELEFSVSIQFVFTECHLGGQRGWWVCPCCENRAALLFLVRGTFACRTCQRISYPSQSETAEDRALRVAGKIRRGLGWEPGIVNPKGPKPKGMHWQTFRALKRKHDAAANRALASLASKIGYDWT
jgi:hypothetical protein